MEQSLGYKGRRSNKQDVSFDTQFKADDSLLSQVMSGMKPQTDIPNGMSQLATTEPAAPTRSSFEQMFYDGYEPYQGGSLNVPQNDGSIGMQPDQGGTRGPIAGGSGMYNEMTGLRGNKAYRNNNPGNITGMGGKLLYGAKGFAKSKTGDKGDQNQLVYATAADGTRAMNQLMSSGRYNNAPIASAFAKWQTDQGAWSRMKNQYIKNGIDVNTMRYNDLSSQQKYQFMKTRAAHEGFQGTLPNIF